MQDEMRCQKRACKKRWTESRNSCATPAQVVTDRPECVLLGQSGANERKRNMPGRRLLRERVGREESVKGREDEREEGSANKKIAE